VVVVEAAKDSGALITAGLAAEQGREVFAVPGKISSSTSSGTNSLIRDGARLVQDVDDIIEELSIVRAVPGPDGSKAAPGADIARMTRAYVRNSLTPEERAAYRAVTDEPLHVDDIIERSGLGAGQASKALLGLQLKKLIQELPGKHYLRKEEPDV
jgi:DNA processing protein